LRKRAISGWKLTKAENPQDIVLFSIRGSAKVPAEIEAHPAFFIPTPSKTSQPKHIKHQGWMQQSTCKSVKLKKKPSVLYFVSRTGFLLSPITS
jgi:hypothetical protein